MRKWEGIGIAQRAWRIALKDRRWEGVKVRRLEGEKVGRCEVDLIGAINQTNTGCLRIELKIHCEYNLNMSLFCYKRYMQKMASYL